MQILILLALACAPKIAGPLYEPLDHQPPKALDEYFAQQQRSSLFDEAVERRLQGDYEGAIHRLVYLRTSGDFSPQTLYQLGLSYTGQEDYATALEAFDLLLTEGKSVDSVQESAGFQRALCLEALGRNEEALAQMRALKRYRGGFDDQDRLTWELQLGISELRTGKDEGVKRIEAALAASEGIEELYYMRSKGWFAIIEAELDRVAMLPLDSHSRRAERSAQANLSERIEVIPWTEQVLEAQLIPMDEPEWILSGLLAVGDAYVALNRDLLAAPAPPWLTPEQAAIYEQTIQEKAAVLLPKAWNRYDMGLTFAGRLGLDGELTQALQERRDNLDLAGS